LAVLVSGAQLLPQFGTEKNRTLFWYGVRSRFAPPMVSCGESNVTVPLRVSLVVSCSVAQYVPDGMFPL
jgi:hypothetical protein